VLARERFVLRTASPARTVAGGVVLDPETRRLRRHDDKVLDALAALVGASPERIVTLALATAGEAGAPLLRLARLAGVSPARAAELLAGAVQAGNGVVVAADSFARLRQRLLKALADQVESQPNGVARRKLTALLPGAGPEALDHAIAQLGAEGALRQDGGIVRLPPRRADAESQARQIAAMAQHMLAALREAGLNPPNTDKLAPTPLGRRILEQLAKDGRVVKTLDRVQKREVVFHPDAVAEVKARLRPLLGGQGLTTGEIGAALGISRKFSVPLLEYLDVVRFTRRQGDRRMLGPDSEV
jgi:selenocysteine-specific elongation factor